MSALMDLAARGALLLVATGVAALLLRRASAAVLCLLWTGAAIGLLGLPVVAGLAPAWQLPVPAGWLPSTPLAATGPPDAGLGGGAEPGAIGSSGGEAAGATSQGSASHPGPPPPRSRRLAGDRPHGIVDRAGPVPLRESSQRNASGPAGYMAAEQPLRASLPELAWPRLLRALWLAGALLLVARTLASLVRGARIVARARPSEDTDLQRRVRRLAARLGIAGEVRLLETSAIGVPVIWHLGRPRLLVPRTLRGWPVRRQESVLLHELAHVKRHDCRTWLLARLAVALHWFNPLAWVALAEIRTHRERACDDAVLRAGVRPSSYARHLLSIARSLQGRPAAFAGGVALLRETGLSRRVRAILDPDTGRTSPNRRTVVTLVACILSLLLPVAAIQPVAAQAPGPPAVAEEPAPAPSPWTPVGEEPFEPGVLPAESAPAAEPAPAPEPAATPVGAPPAPAQEPELDELVRMRIHDVTPEFIEAMTARLGQRPTTEQLVTLRIHDVDPAFVDEMGRLLGESLDVETLVSLSIHDVDPGFARQMRDVLGESLDAEALTRLSIHDVDPALARTMRELFGAEADAEGLVRVSIHDVTPEYARAMRATFGPELGIQQLVKARIHDVDPEDGTELADLLGAGIDLEDVVRLRIQDVDPEYVRAIRELLPAEDLDVDTLLKLRIHDVSPELVRRFREAGYDDLSADELVRIQIHDLAETMLRRNGGRP